ncbi:MAG TPA: serine O-acetyltransferase EpsC [Tepidisphaeraceae bacterium]|nr:serine O-acetyltransferase EpsC [Tepidisphaeraceae bacterium]
MSKHLLNQRLPQVVEHLVRSITSQPTMRHLDRVLLPSRDAVIRFVDLLRQLVFPGYFGRHDLTTENIPFRVGELVIELHDILYDQVRCCLRYREGITGDDNGSATITKPGANGNGTPSLATGNSQLATPIACTPATCDAEAVRVVATFVDRIPDVRRTLAADVQVAFDSDPAAKSTDETIFCYPGLFAIFVQRFAHELHGLDVPLLPRMMTEYAHSRTGIDIHPGAKLGESFFIDHGTGVVIGETTTIGRNVKIYQGVTLGALAPAYGQALRGQKRHPTIEDGVTIYAGATILGGETTIGTGSVIGGNVFITSSVPPHNQVVGEPPKLKFRERRPRGQRDTVDFQI